MYPSAQEFEDLKDTKLVPVALFGLAPAYNVGLPVLGVRKDLMNLIIFFTQSTDTGVAGT